MRARRTRQQLRELIDAVVAFARGRLDGAAADAAAAYIPLFYAGVPPDDLAQASVENLYGSALSLWQLARRRPPGKASVRVYNPRIEEDGWHSPHTVVEIANDDMPFLVDSVAAELNRHGLTVHLVIHPIVDVPRAPDGTAASPPRPAGSGAGLRESHMHIEVDEQSQPEWLDTLRADIERVLADVRAAVEDWQPMRVRLREAADALEREPAPDGTEAADAYERERGEAVDFLRWAADNHFTFLGYREYDLSVEGETVRAQTVPEAGLGLMRIERLQARGAPSGLEALPPEVLAALRDPTPITISKTGSRSTVHRPTHMDIVGVKRLDEDGRLIGERRFVGLFTSTVFTTSPRSIPILRRKVAQCIERAGFPVNSHDEKALAHILETFPRDELFQAGVDELFDIVIGILHLQERQRIALFVRRDPLERFVSCFVFVPRDRYETDLRERIRTILEDAFAGRTTAFRTQVGDELLARMHFVLETTPGAIPDMEPREIERRIVDAGRSWADRLRAALIDAHGEDAGLHLFGRYGDAFPAGYREASGADAALLDIRRIEEALEQGGLAMNLYHPIEAPPERVRFKIYHPAEPVPLSDVLPMLEHMGLRVIGEVPYAVRPAGEAAPVWIHDFEMVTAGGEPVDLRAVRADFQEAFAALWAGTLENDGFNALVLAGGLTAQQVVVIRALSRFLRQAAVPFSPAYLEETIVRHADVAGRIVALFEAKFALDESDRGDRMAVIHAEITTGLDTVTSLDEDRILRRFVNLVDAALRTNYHQHGADGGPKPWLSIKFDSARIEELPLPRPLYEIFVYAPGTEGVHLRGGKVARGGIRWSDRREDFRTEVLGLMKAQMVKNAVIVPVGSKGGFVVKRPPTTGGRDALQAEGIECYRTLLRGMLDITDNLVEGAVVPPPDVIRHDGDDPYLVVAADKGTASFSDIANAVAADYGFWLGDAFASGGSAGYDHKGIGITARGAWESVKRHFRELGRDIQAQDFTCVGVGDMSGDVFGNGMLLSKHTRLVGAFNHMHVFVDPNPDAAASWAERKRLFETPRSTWADYDRSLLSTGGAVYERTAKSVPLSPEVQARFGLTRREVAPAALIRAMLEAEVDLLWFGGIGTYVKSSEESDAEVGDRGNDPVRVDGADLRARVLGEGANLGVTQRGRIEYAAAGGRINADFIDNVSGVDTSDHEVNIKILLGRIVADGDMTLKQRNALLVEMTDDVARLVLRNNYRQGQGLSVAAATAIEDIGGHGRFIRTLERAGALDRAIEQLPNEEELAEREAAHRGLTRPELAVLVSYGKMWLYDTLLASDLPDEPRLDDDLIAYFPPALTGPYRAALERHPLRREIVTTMVTNTVVDRAGFTFVQDIADRTGRPAADIARAFIVARDVFGLPDLWAAVEALDAGVDAALQIRMLRDAARLLERGTRWFLRHAEGPLDMGEAIARFEPGVRLYCERVAEVLPEGLAESARQEAAQLATAGVPEVLARRIAGLDLLGAAPDVVRIAGATGIGVDAAAGCFFAVGERLHLDWLRHVAETFPAETAWQRRAAEAIADDLYGHQGRLAAGAVQCDGDVVAWAAARAGEIERFDRLVDELRGAATVELAMLTVANGALRALQEG